HPFLVSPRLVLVLAEIWPPARASGVVDDDDGGFTIIQLGRTFWRRRSRSLALLLRPFAPPALPPLRHLRKLGRGAAVPYSTSEGRA
ncbi:hypothetical protein BC826DRAFT_992716, partial [Russula brevipes]